MSIWQNLDPHQKDAVDWAWPKLENGGGVGLFFEQGTGKTWIALGVVEKLIAADPKFAGLIIPILTNRDSSWTALINEQLPGVNVAHDWPTFKATPFPKLLVMHRESTRGKRRVTSKGNTTRLPIDQKVVNFQWSIVIIDESQGLNSRASMLSRAARKLRNHKRRMALSGTPIEGKEPDVWAQMRFIDHTVFGEAWTDFKLDYTKPAGFMGKQRVFRQERAERFYRMIKPYCLRVELKDVLNIKPPIIHKVEFELFGTQRRLYEEMENDQVTRLSGKRIMAPLPITAQLRMHQITGGFITEDDGEVMIAGTAKMRRMRRLIESGVITIPLVVFCRFKPDVIAVETQLKKYFKRVEVLWGATGGAKNKSQVRAALNKRFQSGEIDALVCQQKAGGVGIDLFASQCGIIYSCSFSYIDWAQMIARLVRRGQTGQVNFWFLCARNTIDDDIYSAVEGKSTVSKTFNERLKRRASS